MCGRAVAVTLVVGGFLATASAFAVLAVPRAVNQLSQVGEQVPGVISDLDDLPLVGRAIDENGIDDRVRDFLDNLPDTLATRDKALAGIVQSTGDGLVTVFWVLLVAITGLLDGPRLAGELRDVLPARFHAELNHFGDLAYRVVGRYAAGTGFIAIVNAAAVTTHRPGPRHAAGAARRGVVGAVEHRPPDRRVHGRGHPRRPVADPTGSAPA